MHQKRESMCIKKGGICIKRGGISIRTLLLLLLLTDLFTNSCELNPELDATDIAVRRLIRDSLVVCACELLFP